MSADIQYRTNDLFGEAAYLVYLGYHLVRCEVSAKANYVFSAPSFDLESDLQAYRDKSSSVIPAEFARAIAFLYSMKSLALKNYGEWAVPENGQFRF